MNDKMFQEILDKLQPYLPQKWDKVLFFAGYTKGSYSMKYYVYNGSTYTDCFSLKNIDKASLVKLFMSIDKTISAERKQLSDARKWTALSMTVNSDGKMKTDFDYADLSENMIEYEVDWKKKYLN